MTNTRMRFEMWLGPYLGATATATVWDGPLTRLLPFAGDQDGDFAYRLGGRSIDDFLDALHDGPLDEERRWVLGLPVLARSWIEQHQGVDAARGEPILIAIPLEDAKTPAASARTLVIRGDVDPVPIVFEMIGPTIVIRPGESLRLTMSGPSHAELTIGYGRDGISLFRDEQLAVEAYGPNGEKIDTAGFA